MRRLLIRAGATVVIVEAALLGDSTMVLRFLADRVPVDQPNSTGMTALMAAASKGNFDLAMLLLNRGAAILQRHPRGDTAFTYAIEHACRSGGDNLLFLLVLLLASGAAINGVGRGGSSPLRSPIVHGSERILRFLIERGADVNAKDEQGTVLEHAVEAGNLELVRILLDAGARTDGSSGFNPLIRASIKHRTDIAALLRERGASDRTPEQVEAGIAEGMLSAMVITATNPDLMNKHIEETNQVRRKQTGGT